MEILIITGLSGAGKSRAINALEDIGFFCMDNIPPKLVSKVAELCLQSSEHIGRVAMVIDVRGKNMFNSFFEGISELGAQGVEYRILFLDANDTVLENRYKETRRKHPLAGTQNGSLSQCIQQEHELLGPIRERADYIIDTSYLSPAQLKERITNLFLGDVAKGMIVHAMSFGFKYGMPGEADLVFDVRCLPNPFYVDELRNKTGLDKPVHDYVMRAEQTKGFIERLYNMVDYMLPLYADEGKSQLVIAIGCTGGKHRSVTLAEELCRHLTDQGKHTSVNHRDIKKL